MKKADIERAIEDFSHAVNHAKCIESSYIESPIATEDAETALAALRDVRKRAEGCEWCLGLDGKQAYTMFWERNKKTGRPKSARQRMKGKECYCTVCDRSWAATRNISGILKGRCGAITSTIKLVSKARMHNIIDRHWNSAGNTRDYQARYLTREGNGWVACDNTTGDCWVEEFLTAKEAVKWLMAA